MSTFIQSKPEPAGTAAELYEVLIRPTMLEPGGPDRLRTVSASRVIVVFYGFWKMFLLFALIDYL